MLALSCQRLVSMQLACFSCLLPKIEGNKAKLYLPRYVLNAETCIIKQSFYLIQGDFPVVDGFLVHFSYLFFILWGWCSCLILVPCLDV